MTMNAQKRYSVLSAGEATVVQAYLSSMGLAALHQCFAAKGYDRDVMPRPENMPDPRLGISTIGLHVFADRYPLIKPLDMKTLFEQYGLTEADAVKASGDPCDMLFQVYWRDYVPRKERITW